MNRSYSIIRKVCRKAIPVLLAGLLYCPVTAIPAPRDGDVPVAPVAPTQYAGWTNAFRLKNSELLVVIVPDIGRIVFLGPNSKSNLLRSDENLEGKFPAPAEEGTWLNYGGDWLWPVAQSHWKDFQGGDWPPSRLLDGRPWSGSAWKCADGGLSCLVSQNYGEPLHIKVSRLIKIRTNSTTVVIRQKVERVAESDIPVCLWNISQISAAESVVIATDSDSALDDGFRPMMFAAPGENALTRCNGAVVYDTAAGGESKLCSDSKRAWIAALKNNMVITERVRNPAEGTYPDNGCTIEMYSNSGLGYSEIETLSIEKDLEVGEFLENTLEIQLHRLPADSNKACDLAMQVMKWLGEKPAESENSPAPGASLHQITTRQTNAITSSQ